MALNIDVVKEDALKELGPRILPAKNFISEVKSVILNGADAIGQGILGDWMFVIPVMYGELRCIESECLLAVDLYESEIDRVKADSQASKAVDVKVTEARAQAALLTNDLKVRQFVAKFMAKYVNSIWSELEMLIFSVRGLFESRLQKVKNDV